MYGEGISREGSLVDIATEMEIIQKSGAWFSYNGDRLGQGRENAKQFLKDNPAVAATIEKQIRDASSLTNVIPASGVSVDDEEEEAALFGE